MSDALLPDIEPDDDGNDDGREFAVDEDALDAEAEDDLDEDDPALSEDEAATLRKGLAT